MRPDHVLIEAKSATGLGTVDRLLPRLGARPLTMCSKYCLGVALAHPGSPHQSVSAAAAASLRPDAAADAAPTPLPALAASADLAAAVNA